MADEQENQTENTSEQADELVIPEGASEQEKDAAVIEYVSRFMAPRPKPKPEMVDVEGEDEGEDEADGGPEASTGKDAGRDTRAERRKIAAERRAVAKAKKEVQAQLDALKSKDPVEHLKAAGVDLGKLAERIITGRATADEDGKGESSGGSEIAALRAKIELLEHRIEMESAQKQKSSFASEISSKISEESHPFLLSDAGGSGEAAERAMALIQRHWEDTARENDGEGEELDVEEALEALENFYKTKAERYAKVLGKASSSSRPPKTLRSSGSTGKRVEFDSLPYEERERIELERLQGQLSALQKR